MASYTRTTSRGIPVLTPTPSGAGGDLINDALIALAAQSAPLHRHAGAPDANDDSEDTGGNGATQTYSLWWDTTNKVLYWCTDASEGAAVWETLTSGVAQAFVGIPLTDWRASPSNDIQDMTDTPSTDELYGSLLHKGSAPKLECINGDTDGALRLNWGAGVQTPIITQIPLPPDLDTSADVVLHFRGAMSGVTDTPSMDADSYFNEADTKVSDVSDALFSSAYVEITITIAAADVPSGAQTLTIELTPQAHGNDEMYVTATWLEYTRLHLTS